MGILLDLIVLAILITLSIVGYKKGLIKSVMGLVSLIIAIVIAINFYGLPANFIKEKLVEPYFVNNTSDVFSALMNGGTETITPEQIFEDKPQALIDISEKFGFDLDTIEEFYEKNIKNTFEEIGPKDTADRLSQFVVGSAVDTVSNILGFTLAFIVSLIVLNLSFLLINFLFKLPGLNLANKLAGGILGLLKGLVMSIIILNIVTGLASATEDSQNGFWNKSALNESTAYSVASDYGIIFIK